MLFAPAAGRVGWQRVSRAMDSSKVLILNQTFEALQVCGARRAVVLLYTGRAERVEDTTWVLRSPSVVFPVPSVIRLHRYVRKPPLQTLSFNKKNILKRDGHTCQYCGRNSGERMTIDHVLPRSLGGRTIWENVVSACRACNLRKGNRTPPEAGMTLLRPPAKPISVFYLGILATSRERLEAWRKYLPAGVVAAGRANGPEPGRRL